MPLPRLILLGAATTGFFLLVAWYSSSSFSLQLLERLPSLSFSSFSSLPLSFSTSAVDVLGYRLPLPVAVILTVNVAVFVLWRVPSLQPLMYRHFTTDLYRVVYARQLHTLITHAFSHQSFLHLFFNCFAFATIAPSVCFFLSDAQFAGFYLSAAAVSSLIGFALTGLFSIPSHRAAQLRIPALGASGAVFAVFAASALIFPEVHYRILFIPYDIPASTLLPCAAAFDVGGLVYNMLRGSPLGHGAHLGGMAWGVFVYKVWIERQPLLKRVREERERRRAWAQRR